MSAADRKPLTLPTAFPDSTNGLPRLKRDFRETNLEISITSSSMNIPEAARRPNSTTANSCKKLENRGFYVATQARSNYLWTTVSIPSALKHELHS